jgi:hypothetical protein
LQSDRDILQHIVYDFNDSEMMEALRPSIEEAQPINTQMLALDYIGKRASQVSQFCADADTDADAVSFGMLLLGLSRILQPYGSCN